MTGRRKPGLRLACLAIAMTLFAVSESFAQPDSASLRIYYIDTEGGQATLFVGPSGESLLVDSGNAGERDLGRILAALDFAGVSRIDHMWTTHYHGDHVGSLLALAERVPIERYYDHGQPHAGDRIISADFLSAYDELTRGKRTVVSPGFRLPMAGVDIVTVATDGNFIEAPLPSGGSPNPACAAVSPLDESGYFDPDNGASAGFVLTFGRFRTIDLGDLTWNGELELMCPSNPIGVVDVYLTSHHGLAQSGSPALVHALMPRVAVMNNGTRKGGAPEAFRVLYESQGLQDLWQLHWSHNARLENSPAVFIANVDDDAAVAEVLTAEPAGRGRFGRGGFGPGGGQGHEPAHLIHIAAQEDGSFVVSNERNGFSKSYAAAP